VADIRIRTALPNDADQLFVLAKEFATSFRPERDAFEMSLNRIAVQDDALLLVAEQSRQLSGYLLGFDHYTLFANGRVSWVEEMMVRHDRRRQRIGARLLREFEEWTRSRESRYVAVATRRAANFYLAEGYEESATYFRKVL
jgi:GNAT superfamily N-acetyltransferase